MLFLSEILNDINLQINLSSLVFKRFLTWTHSHSMTEIDVKAGMQKATNL